MSSFRPKNHAIVFFAILIGLMLLNLLWTPTPIIVEAEESDLVLALAAYPAISDTALDSCFLCHTSDTGQNPPLNSYGEDYLDAGRDLAAFGSIEALDSDNDTYANIIEINALSFPGDAASTPAPTATATSTPAPTATATSTPTSTPTATPTNTSTPLPTATATPIPTATPTATAPPIPTVTPTATAPPIPTVTPTPTPTSTAVSPTMTPSPTPTYGYGVYLPIILVQ